MQFRNEENTGERLSGKRGSIRPTRKYSKGCENASRKVFGFKDPVFSVASRLSFLACLCDFAAGFISSRVMNLGV